MPGGAIGNTSPFGGEVRGSNPCPAANKKTPSPHN